MQWAEFLMGYDCEIIYQPGKENIVADYLLRALLVAYWKVVQQCADICNGLHTSTIRKASQLLSITLEENQSVIFLFLTHGCNSSSQLWGSQVVSTIENITQGELVKQGHLVPDILASVAVVIVVCVKHLFKYLI